jgi:hypothetical protein
MASSVPVKAKIFFLRRIEATIPNSTAPTLDNKRAVQARSVAEENAGTELLQRRGIQKTPTRSHSTNPSQSRCPRHPQKPHSFFARSRCLPAIAPWRKRNSPDPTVRASFCLSLNSWRNPDGDFRLARRAEQVCASYRLIVGNSRP